MPKSSLRGRPGTGPSGRPAMSAAARAAAKRAAKAEGLRGPLGPLGPLPNEPDEPDAPDPGSAAAPEAAAEPAAEPAPAEGAEARPSGPAAGRTTPRVLTAVLAALVVAGLVAGLLLTGAYRHGQSAGRARTQALAEARKAGPVVLSYDYRHLDRDFAAALTHLTGPFREQYRKTTATVVAPTATQYHGVVTASVQAASVVSAAPDRVVILLFMNQLTRSTRLDAPRLDLNRVRLTLVHTSAGWRVSAVDAL